MTHISRPIQIALAGAVLLVAVWFIVLRGHSASTSSGSGSSGSSAPSAASSPQGSSAKSAPGGGTPASKGQVYHGSAPGVEGLSRAIKRAQGAVTQSQQEAQKSSQEASGGGQSQSAQGQTQHSQAQSGQQAQSQTQPSQHSQASQRQQQSPRAQRQHPLLKHANGVPARQILVEGELAHGKTVAVLFWNPKGAVDATVRRELQAADRAQHGKLAIHVARSSEVGSFGSFTHAVQVYSTPTILLINTKGKTSSLAGLTDLFSIQQAIAEVRKVK